MINNQQYLDKTRGSFGKLGSIAGNGCGAIAMTNICLMEKVPMDLDKMIKLVEKNNGTLAGGLLGMNPCMVSKIMKKFGFKVKYLGKLTSINQLKKYKYFIILYGWAEKMTIGAHYQAGRLIANNQIELFNPYAVYDSVAELKQGESTICPVIFGVNV